MEEERHKFAFRYCLVSEGRIVSVRGEDGRDVGIPLFHQHEHAVFILRIFSGQGSPMRLCIADLCASDRYRLGMNEAIASDGGISVSLMTGLQSDGSPEWVYGEIRDAIDATPISVSIAG